MLVQVLDEVRLRAEPRVELGGLHVADGALLAVGDLRAFHGKCSWRFKMISWRHALCGVLMGPTSGIIGEIYCGKNQMASKNKASEPDKIVGDIYVWQAPVLLSEVALVGNAWYTGSW